MTEQEKQEYLDYIHNIRNSHKTNYYLASLKEIDQYEKEYPTKKARILLHVCCIVCACWPIDFLKKHFHVSVIFNNSNIYPESEYHLRFHEVKRYLHEKYHDEIEIIELPYRQIEFINKLRPRAHDPEGWKRCFMCYEDRLIECFRYGEKHGFDYFTTVMTFSRQKNSQKINQIGAHLQKQFTKTKYFFSDFKKADGTKKANEIVEKYHIYRQDYCGCIFSYREKLKRLNKQEKKEDK